MDKAERADRIGIGQIAIEVRDLWREQQAFVDDGSTRQGRDVEEFFVFDVRLADLFFGELADDVKFALECVFVHFRWPTDENLLNVRLRRPRDAPDGIAIYWRIAPTEDGESLFADCRAHFFLGEAGHFQVSLHGLFDRLPGEALHLEAPGDVAGDALPREERELLEHHAAIGTRAAHFPAGPLPRGSLRGPEGGQPPPGRCECRQPAAQRKSRHSDVSLVRQGLSFFSPFLTNRPGRL